MTVVIIGVLLGVILSVLGWIFLWKLRLRGSDVNSGVGSFRSQVIEVVVLALLGIGLAFTPVRVSLRFLLIVGAVLLIACFEWLRQRRAGSSSNRQPGDVPPNT